MKKKILTFVASEGKFLALYSEPHPDHGEGGWFVVTGGVEENETHEEAVAREILEETGLVVDEIISLNWGSIYNWRDELYEELNFLSFVKPEEIILNEEHSKFDWLDVDEFIERIKWDDDKELLKIILEKALNKEKYFNEIIFKDYRK
jgi:8-oxo-dGTP pyrophosphatase MutT (NUDIX family)